MISSFFRAGVCAESAEARSASTQNSRNARPRLRVFIRSEIVLERKLNLAHAGASPRDLAEARDRGLVRAAPSRVGRAQLDVVRRIEHLHAELESMTLADAEVLYGREIDVHLPRPAQIVAGTVSELPPDRVVERGRVVPGGRRRIVEYRVDAGGTVCAVAVR